ncbi:hypothetical protein SCHPADRAFT_543437 [Schizopora paradoxa]|uniref:Uncharacterized protein n=1 Tax=Schizopora paradoxa TaxID=27342 RepID=A0A0H2RDL5_9AGAM|nr:hypothetical protein SCHPADRAFT_543437 [Schizopora paradoxa]
MDTQIPSDGLSLLFSTYQSLYSLGLARMAYGTFVVKGIVSSLPVLDSDLPRRYYHYLPIFDKLLVGGSTIILNNLEFWSPILVYSAFQILVTLRTIALYHGSKHIKLTVILIYIIYLLVAIAMGSLFSVEGTCECKKVWRGRSS